MLSIARLLMILLIVLLVLLVLAGLVALVVVILGATGIIVLGKSKKKETQPVTEAQPVAEKIEE